MYFHVRPNVSDALLTLLLTFLTNTFVDYSFFWFFYDFRSFLCLQYDLVDLMRASLRGEPKESYV